MNTKREALSLIHIRSTEMAIDMMAMKGRP